MSSDAGKVVANALGGAANAAINRKDIRNGALVGAVDTLTDRLGDWVDAQDATKSGLGNALGHAVVDAAGAALKNEDIGRAALGGALGSLSSQFSKREDTQTGIGNVAASAFSGAAKAYAAGKDWIAAAIGGASGRRSGPTGQCLQERQRHQLPLAGQG